MLIGALGLDTLAEQTAVTGIESPFVDVSLESYPETYGRIMLAYDFGIINGIPAGDELWFEPGSPATREQMAAMLARFYALSGITAAGSADGYADADAISAWAVNGVALCTARGLVQGAPQGRFRPQSDLTRAQIAAILSRMAE